MTVPQIIFVVLLVAALLGLAGYYGWFQVRTLLRVRATPDLTREDRRYFLNQSFRRLVGCVLMVLFAGLLAGWFLLGIDDLANRLVLEGQAAQERGEPIEPTPEQRKVIYLSVTYAFVTLLVLAGLVGTALLDLWAIRGFSKRHQKKIDDDRQAMIARQVARLRSQRNGHN